MTEYNLFCYAKKHNYNDSFQQERYRAFNKLVGKERYFEILKEVRSILHKEIKLQDFWKSVTTEQWNLLLSIPEAKDFKSGFEFISGVKIGRTIVLDGKEIVISEESFKALKDSLCDKKEWKTFRFL